MQNASKFLFFLISLSLVSAFAFAAHDTAITIDPNITLCGVDSVDYTVTVENLAGSTDKIREVRIYDDLDNDGQRDAGITDFNCFTDVSPPTGWTVHDELAINNYCRYTTSSSSGNVNKISPGNSKEFTFKATLDNSSLSACGNTFKVETIDDKIPSGEVQFKFPQIHVDCSPPIIQKMVDKPKIPMSALCNEDALVQGGENEACNYWITQNTTISFSAQDNNTLVDNGEIVEAPENLSCDAGLDYCQWKYSLDGDETPENFESQCEESGGEIEGDWCVLSDGNILEFEFDFDEDSEHTLIVECYDLAGNKTSLTETDKVDGTDPETTKELVGAQKIENGIEWIDTNSSVVITAADPDPTGFSCNIGVEATFYKLSLEDGDSACENQEEACFPMELPEEFAQCYWSVKDACVNSWEENYDSYQDCVIDQALNQCGLSEAGWQLYEGPIENIEESCHNLTFFSVDELGNVEEPNVNCFFVDKTPPIIEKEVGDPKVECEEEGCDWFIGKNTPITLSCNDPEPHPSGDVTIHYRYRVDEGNGFGSWTDINSTQAEEIVFTFQENSMHELEYWCTDAVDKESQHYFEIDKVDSEPPIITKEMIGTQHLGYRDGVLNEEACPPNPNENDVCYVADNGENGVSILAADVNSIHAVHGVSCTYEVWWHTDSENCESQYDVGTNRCLVDSDEFSDHAEVIFTEDSTHDLEIVCQDALGNSVEDIEQFLVDSNPPETTKMYGEPFFACSDWCELECEYEGDGDCVSSCEQNFCGGFDAQGGEPYPHWITSDTNVSLWSEDAKVGVDKIYWRNMVITDPQGWGACNYAQPYDHGDIVENGPQPIFCNPELYSQFIPGYNEIPFTPVDGNHAVFNKEEESCHVIEYYSVDLLGNEEPLNWQCVFVDNSPPVGNKDIGKPHVIKTDGQVCEDNGEDVEESSFEVGDLVHQLSADELPVDSAGNHCAIGVAFDGENLYYNRCSDDNIYKINPVTGELLDTFDTGISLNPNAMAYDATRNGIWFGTQSCDGTGMPIYFWDLSDDSVTLEFHVTSATINPATGDDFLGFCFLDGLAFNANGSGDADDELWFSDDVNPNLGVFRPDGSFVTGYDSTDTDPDLALLSGLAIGGSNLYMGNNGGGDVFRANSTTLAFVDQFASEDERLEDMECDPNTFAPTEVMWVRHTPQGNPADDLISAFAIESGTCGVGGEEPPVCQGEEWVTTETIFTLSCDDPEPHPVDHSIVHWRFSFHPNGDINGLVEYSEWNWDEGPVQVSFEQESLHNLEYYCEDALGNQNEVDIEYFFVEDTPPIITKTIEGPSFAPEGSSCDQEATKNSENKCYVDTATRILVEAVDPEPHPVDDVTCKWRYSVGEEWFNDDFGDWNSTFPILFPEESYHTLQIICEDALGNATEYDTEYFIVDKTPPVTEKRFSEEPYFSCQNWCEEQCGYEGAGQCVYSCVEQYCAEDAGGHIVPQWGTSDLNVFLNAYDPEPHPSDVNMTFYRISLVEDHYCDVGSEEQPEEEYNEIYCNDAEGSGEWVKYNGEPFNVPEESCHLIEYYSVDNVQKTEEAKRECIYIDNTGPNPVKTVGEPSDVWTPGENGDPLSIFYPYINDSCWVDQNGIDCWNVTLLTPVTMSCVDPEPHPVNHSSIYFMVDFDGEDFTEQYCNEYYGYYTDDGWCHIEKNEQVLFFLEESEHNLKYYCEDALGNIGPLDDEKFKVEGSSFKINLNKKWNLISVPFVLQNDDPAAIFADLNGTLDAVWTYDASTGQWYVFRPGMPEASNLDSIMPGMGYWVSMLDDDMLLLGGSLFSPQVTPPSKEIVGQAWNLIGYYGVDSPEDEEDNPMYDGPSDPFFNNSPDGDGKQAACALFSLGDSFDDKGWTSLLSYWEPDNPDQWKQFNYFDSLDPGAGYWVLASEDGTYSYTTVCGFI